MSAARCEKPIGQSALAEYRLGELSPDAERSVEEHLFACAACTDSSTRLFGLFDALRAIARSGTVRTVLTRTFLDRLGEEGLRLRQYRVEPWGSVACTVAPEDDFLVARLVADLGAARRVDLVWLDPEGRPVSEFRDVPLEPSGGEIIFAERIDQTRALPASVHRARLIAVDDTGERILAEYTFNHTPFTPSRG